jgi:hypothetical protein
MAGPSRLLLADIDVLGFGAMRERAYMPCCPDCRLEAAPVRDSDRPRCRLRL